MKKVLSGVLCLAMMLSMGATAFAAEIRTDGGTQNTVVSYGMSEGFTVTIPTNFNIDDSRKATANVSASNVMIAHGATLKVTISGDDWGGSWELIDAAEASNQLTYTIGTTEGGNDIVNNSVVLSVGAGEAYNSTVTETMHFTVVDELSKAGEYSDTLTFTVSVVGDAGLADEEFSFTLRGETYSAAKDMTWSQWRYSDYHSFDTDSELFASPEGGIVLNDYFIYLDEEVVYGTDKIIPGANYQ